MSTSLYWTPAPRDVPPAEGLPYELKKAIAQRLWGHDGSVYGEKVELSRATAIIPYLEGLADAGVDGAAELIRAINTHDSVLVWIGE